MGTQIGDYIHWKYDNYLKYGIDQSRNRGEGRPDISSICNDQQENIKAQAQNIYSGNRKEGIKQYIDQYINYFFNKDYRESHQDQVQDVSKILTQTLNRGISTISIDENAHVHIQGAQSGGIGQSNLSGTIRFTADAVERRIGAMQKVIEEMKRKSGPQKVSELSNRVKKLNDIWDEITNGIQKGLEAVKNIRVSAGGGSYYLSDEEIKLNDGSVITTRSFIKDLNELLTNFRSGLYRAIAGDAGETMLPLLEKVSQKKIESVTDDLQDYLKKTLVGKESSKARMSKSNFAVYMLPEQADYQKKEVGQSVESPYFVDYGTASLDVLPTQDKIDAILNFNGEIAEDAEKNIRASVKNYSIPSQSTRLTLLNGVGPLYYLQDSSNHIFLNHYLNIVSTHDEESKENPSHGDIVKANRALMMSLALKAMAGGVLKEFDDGSVGMADQAEVFLVNRSIADTGYAVVFIDDYIEAIINNIDSDTFKRYISIEGFDEGRVLVQSKEPPLNVPSRGSAFRRIARLLALFSEEKLKMSISAGAVSELSQGAKLF